MSKACSLDLRERICAYIGRGHSARAAGRVFGVSAATAVRFAAKRRSIVRAEMLPRSLKDGRPVGSANWPRISTFPLILSRAEPDITLKELAAALSGTEGVQVQLSSLHLSSLHRALKRAGLSYKTGCHIKKGLIAAERDRPARRLARREWIMRRHSRECAGSRTGWSLLMKRLSKRT